MEIRDDRNSGIRVICQSIHKLFDYVSNKIQCLQLFLSDRGCLKKLKDEIENTKTGITNINIILNTSNRIVKVKLNEKIKINDLFINKISRIPNVEKIELK